MPKPKKDVDIKAPALRVGTRMQITITELFDVDSVKDKKGVVIKEKDYLKKTGKVQFAEGNKLKVSKRTWMVGLNDDGKLILPKKKDHIDYLIIGNEKEGILKKCADLENGKTFEKGEKVTI